MSLLQRKYKNVIYNKYPYQHRGHQPKAKSKHSPGTLFNVNSAPLTPRLNNLRQQSDIISGGPQDIRLLKGMCRI